MYVCLSIAASPHHTPTIQYMIFMCMIIIIAMITLLIVIITTISKQ